MAQYFRARGHMSCEQLARGLCYQKEAGHIGGLWYKFNSIHMCACVKACILFLNDQLSKEKPSYPEKQLFGF